MINRVPARHESLYLKIIKVLRRLSLKRVELPVHRRTRNGMLQPCCKRKMIRPPVRERLSVCGRTRQVIVVCGQIKSDEHDLKLL